MKTDFNIKPNDAFDRKIEAIQANTTWVFRAIIMSVDQKVAEVYFSPRTGYRDDEFLMVVMEAGSDQAIVQYYFPDTFEAQVDKDLRFEFLRFQCSINDAWEAGKLVTGCARLFKDKLNVRFNPQYELPDIF